VHYTFASQRQESGIGEALGAGSRFPAAGKPRDKVGGLVVFAAGKRVADRDSAVISKLAFLEGGAFMIAWMLGAIGGPIMLAGFVVYLCRGPRRHRRLTREQIAELQFLTDIERHENLT